MDMQTETDSNKDRTQSSDDSLAAMISSTSKDVSRLSSTDNDTNGQGVNLMDMSLELREIIYKHTLRIGAMAILRVSQQVYKEASTFIRYHAYLRVKNTRVSTSKLPTDSINLIDLSRLKNIAITVDFPGLVSAFQLYQQEGFLNFNTQHLPRWQNLDITFHIAHEPPRLSDIVHLLYLLNAWNTENLFITFIELIGHRLYRDHKGRRPDEITVNLLKDRYGPVVRHQDSRKHSFAGWWTGRLDGGQYLEFHPHAFQEERRRRKCQKKK